MKIGQFAQRAGVGIDTVRYYERHGLLSPPGRRASGYREYGEQDLAPLRCIRRAKALGCTLMEIQERLALSGQQDHSMAAVKAAAAEKLADVEARMAELTRVRDGLRTLVDACPGHGARATCPILNALAGEQE